MTDWNKSTVAVLKAELKKRDLPINGLKAELVDRLTTSDQESVADIDAPKPADAETVPAESIVEATADAPQALPVDDKVKDDITTTTTIISQPSIDPQEVINDLETRRKRSRSPPPSLAQSPRKRARQDESSSSINADIDQFKDQVETSQADEDWVQKHNGVDETVVNADPDVATAQTDQVAVAPVDAAVEPAQNGVTDPAGQERNEETKVDVAQSDVDWVAKHNNVDEEMLDAQAEEVAPAGQGVEPGPTIVDTSMQDVVVEDVAETAQLNDTIPGTVANPMPSSPNQSRDARFKGLFNGSTQDHTEESTYNNDRDQEPDRAVAPAIHPATSALYIRNFQRPLNLASLKEHITIIAAPPGTTPSEDIIQNIFLDTLRTHALIEFANISAASRVRSEMHDRIWPAEVNRASLWADFIPSEKVEEWISTEQSSGGRGPNAKVWEIHYDEDESGSIVASLRQATSVPAARRQPSIQQESSQTGLFRDMPAPPSGPRAEQYNHRTLPPPSGPRAPSTQDNLTKSTSAQPTIYYQPVSAALAQGRLDSIQRALSKRLYDENTTDIHRYSFERGDVLIDRGEERFPGIRPPPRLERGGYMGGRGGSNYRGRNDSWRGGRVGGDRYDSYSSRDRYAPRDEGRLNGRDDRGYGRDERRDYRYVDRRY